jgi:hypothetical protein
MNNEAYVAKRIEMIQDDLERLKKLLSPSEGEVVSLEGIWEGLDVSDEEIEEAKRSLFKGAYLDESN